MIAITRSLPAPNSTIRRAGPGRPPAASPPHACSHTATLLPDGKVLVAGGMARRATTIHRERGALRSSERHLDGALAALMSHAGITRTTLLPDGKVLVAGGPAVLLLPSRERGTLHSSKRKRRVPAASCWPCQLVVGRQDSGRRAGHKPRYPAEWSIIQKRNGRAWLFV